MLTKYLILAGYFLILFLIGAVASKKVKNIKDYFVGGKKLGYWVVSFSSRATGSSAWVLLGLTGMGAIYGVYAYWVVVGTLLGVATAWFVMAKPFKRSTDQYDAITIPDYLVARFTATTPLLRSLAASALSVFVIIYVSAQIDATGTAFESFLGWNYYTGAFVGFGIVVAYMYAGGFVAVAWSDLFQGLLMLSGLFLLPVVALWHLGPPTQWIAALKAIDTNLVSPFGPTGFGWQSFAQVTGWVMIGLGYLGSPQLFVRFMSIKNEAEINRGRWVALALALFMNGLAVTVGIIGRILLTQPGDDPIAQLGNGGQNVLIGLVENLLPLALSGVYIAAILAAIMSTIDSLLIVASSAVTRDFYQKTFHPDMPDQQLTQLSRWVTLLLALLALVISITVAAFVPGRTIFWFVIFGWSGIAATFCPTMILALFWPRYNERGAIASMITGFICVPVFKFLAPELPGIGIFMGFIAELLPAFLMALLAGWIATNWKPNAG